MVAAISVDLPPSQTPEPPSLSKTGMSVPLKDESEVISKTAFTTVTQPDSFLPETTAPRAVAQLPAEQSGIPPSNLVPDNIAENTSIPNPADLLPDAPKDPIPLPSNPVPPEPIAPELTQPELTPPAPITPEAVEPDVPVVETTTIQQVIIRGSTIFSQDELEPLLEAFQNRPLSPEEIQSISSNITRLYGSKGYITSRALPPVVNNGIAQIEVIEGKIAEIEFSGTSRVSQNYIRRRIELGTGKPLNAIQLEEQLRLLRLSPLFDEFSASLRAGDGPGESILAVQVKEAQEFTADLSIDNTGAPSVGAERVGLQMQYQNLTGNGDVLSGGYKRSRTGGSQQYNVNYSTPINPMNGTISASANITRSKITEEAFDNLNISSNSERYTATYRQPIIRTPRQELAVSAGFTYQDGHTFFTRDSNNNPDAEETSRTSVVQIGQDYVRRDVSGAWALRSQFNIGTGLFNATAPSGRQAESQFFSWSAQAQRVQRLTASQLLIARAELQLSPNSLLPSQQFAVGGRYSVRGYRENRSLGDNGFRVSLEDRITLARRESGASSLQLAPFVEAGKTWNSKRPTPRIDTWLAGAGVGLIWQPQPEMQLRVDYGMPLIAVSDRQDDLQDKGVYFSASYQF